MPKKPLVLLFFLLSLAVSPPVHPQDLQELLKVGIGAFEDGFWEVAEAQWRQFLKDYPNHPLAPKVRYLLGRTLIEEGKFKEAAAELMPLVGQEGVEQGDLNYWLGFSLVQQGRWKEAERPLETALKSPIPKELVPSALMLLGEAKYRLKKCREAIPLLRKALLLLRGEPHSSRAKLLLGVCLSRRGKLEEAIKVLKGVKGKFEEDALYWLGETELRAGRPLEAAETFKRLCAKYPTSHLLPEVRYKLAYALLKAKRPREAEAVLRRWLTELKGHPLEGKAQLLLGRVLMKEKRFKDAIEVLKEVAKKGGVEAREAHYRLVWSYLQIGDLETAQKLLGRYEDDITHYLRAEAELWKGKCKEALPYLFELMNRKPFRKKALLEIARCCYRMGKYQDCIANLDILKLEFPDFEKIDELLWLKAECLRGAGEEGKAAKLYRKIWKTHPTSERAPWALWRLLDGAIKQGKLKEAQGYFEKLKNSFGDHELTARGALLLGRTLVEAGRYKEAIPKLEIARRSPIKEIKGRALCWLGKAYLRLGALGKALLCYEEAATEGGEVAALAYVEVGNINAELGDTEAAKKAYQKALKLTKDETLKSRIEELLEFVTEGKEAG